MQFLLRNLVLKLCRRILFGDTEQDTIIIVLNLEQFYITCARHKTVVIAVDVTVELIVACIKMVVCLEQTHLVHAPDTGKHLYRFGRVTLHTLERDVARNDVEHPLAHCNKLIIGKRAVHTAIVAFGNGILEADSLARKHLIHCLHEDKEQRTHIHAHSVIRSNVNELDILVAVYAFGKPFSNIVYLGCNYAMRHVKSHTVVYFLKRKTALELLGNTIVLAIYPYHSHKFLSVIE